MLNQLMLYVGSLFLVVWGAAHLFPTQSVVKGFGDISIDNKRIIAMEWITEGMALIFMGVVIFTVTIMEKSQSKTLKSSMK